MNKKNIAYLGIGTNLGNKLENIKNALSQIEDDSETEINSKSSIYETKPFGFTEQDNFLNLVIKISTNKNQNSLFSYLQSIEKKVGRVKKNKWGPRIIDLDILFFNDEIYSDEKITIPHKGIIERDFVLIPMEEIEPNFIHPALKEKITDICKTNLQKQIIGKVS